MSPYPIPGGAVRVLERLNAAGFEAYLVGGCVRDLLRGVEPQDYDVCTAALPEEIQTCFAGERLIDTGLRHGTVTVVLDGQPFEVTTYRADGPYSDGRHPDTVEFVPSLTEDLARRDFCMNAMAIDLAGALQDPFGGAEDIRLGRIRCVGEPDRRFREDGLRLMRALRFSATLGYDIEPETAAAVVRNAKMLDCVAAERVNTELCKLLMGKNAVAVLRACPEVLCRFWGELGEMAKTPQNHPCHCFDVWEHTLHALARTPEELVVRLAVLLHDVGKPLCRTTDPAGIDHFYNHPKLGAELAEAMLRRLKFDNATRKRVVELVERHDVPIQATEKSVRRWLGRLGEEAFFQLLAVKAADSAGHAPDTVAPRLAEVAALEALARTVLEQGQCFALKDLAVRGQDVIAAGVSPGPAVGSALQGLLERVIAGELPNERAALLAALNAPPAPR